VIGLYVRDHEQWVTETKRELARKWIEELNDCNEFRGFRFTVKIVTEFIRVQEKKFRKALEIARQLDIPPPPLYVPPQSPQSLGLALEMMGSPEVYKANKDPVHRACPFFKQLFHTLAPTSTASTALEMPDSNAMTNFWGFRYTSLSVSGSHFNQASPTLPSPTLAIFNTSESATSNRHLEDTVLDPIYSYPMDTDNEIEGESSTAPSSIFDSPSPQISSRSTSSSPEIPEFIFQTISHGFPPRPIPKPYPTSTLPISNLLGWQSDSNRSGVNKTSGRLVNLAPIPLLLPKAGGFAMPSQTAETDSLAAQLNHLNVDSPNRESFSGAEIPRKLKRTSASVSPSGLQRQYEEALRKRRRSIIDGESQKRVELETVIRGENEYPSTQFGNFTTSEPSIPGNRSRIPTASPQRSFIPYVTMPSIEIAPIDCSPLTASLGNLFNSLVCPFESFDSPVTSIRKRKTFEEQIDKLCDEAGASRNIPNQSAAELRSLATKISRLCRIRRELWKTYPSTKPIAYLQKRHRPQRNDPTQNLRVWLTEHASNPYPSKWEQEELSKQTGLSVRAVRDWFRNARFRGISYNLRANVQRLERKHRCS